MNEETCRTEARAIVKGLALHGIVDSTKDETEVIGKPYRTEVPAELLEYVLDELAHLSTFLSRVKLDVQTQRVRGLVQVAVTFTPKVP